MTEYAADHDSEDLHKAACDRVNLYGRMGNFRRNGQPDYDKIARQCEQNSLVSARSSNLDPLARVDEAVCWSMAANMARERQAQRDLLLCGAYEAEVAEFGL